MVEFSFELYSARKFPPLDAVLAELARIGYTQVEGYEAVYGDPEKLAETLARDGLTMPTGHFGLSLLEDSDKAMRIAETLGIKILFCPGVSGADRTQPDSGWEALGKTLEGLAETYRQAGYGLGWHNHSYEFAPTESGRKPIDIILETAPSLSWEMDVGWLVHAGEKVAPWLDRYGPRIRAIHIKDWAPEWKKPEEDGQADVGHGVLDWPKLFTEIRARSAAEYFIMEHDNPSDYARFARRSLASARSWPGAR